MSRFTVVRVEVDSALVERVLGVTPGVEVVEAFDADTSERRSADAGDGTTRSASEPTSDGPADEEGLLAKATPDGDLLDGDARSVFSEYGLLGLGVSLVMLGVATVGIWVYRRRSGGSDEADSATTGFERGGEPAEFDADTRRAGPDEPPATASKPTSRDGDEDADGPSLSIVTSADEADERDERDEADERDERDEAASEAPSTAEPAGRTDDRADVEWTTKWESGEGPTDTDEADAPSEPAESEPRASESVDLAPLLGVAFVALSGALVRWLRGDEE